LDEAARVWRPKRFWDWRENVKTLKRGQSTLEWVIGAAIILGTLVVGIMAWNNGLVAKIGQMVQRLTQTS
jgi:hypothetical protein